MCDRAVILAGGNGDPVAAVYRGPAEAADADRRVSDSGSDRPPTGVPGFRRITLAVNHQANLIKAFFGTASMGSGDRLFARIQFR